MATWVGNWLEGEKERNVNCCPRLLLISFLLPLLTSVGCSGLGKMFYICERHNVLKWISVKAIEMDCKVMLAY